MKDKIAPALLSVLLLVNITLAQSVEQVISPKADSLINEAYRKGLFSGVVLISHHGKEIYSKEMGYADWSTKRVITKNSLFNIGSLNKKFTEEIIHQLVKEKKLSYADRLSTYLDLFPAEIGNKITIRQLLDMQAGLGDFLQNPQYVQELKQKDFSLADLLEIIKKEPLLFESGTSQAYSNSGYVVLGAVVEKITGKSYEKNLTERIIKPLNLKNLYYTKAGIQQQSTRAYGTEIDFEGRKKSTDDVVNSTPAGGMYANSSDLLTFAEAILPLASAQNEKQGIRMFAGGSPGWNSAIAYNEKNSCVVVVLANMGDDIAVKLAKRLHSILLGEPFPPLDLPFKIVLYKAITEQGYAYVKANVQTWATQQRLPYDDRFLNFFAQEFSMANKTEIALNLYKVNSELFPKSIRTYEALAETYIKIGDKINGLTYLNKIKELDPANPKVRKLLTDLESEK